MIYYYKLCCKDLNVNECYVGSTKQPLRKRFYQHKKSCNNINSKSYNEIKYVFIRENGGIENWIIVEIERIDEDLDNQQRFKRERFWLEELKATLNSNIPNRSIKEYYAENKDKINEYHKQYRLDNKKQIIEINKQYRLNNKEQIKEKKKQYRLDNKEKIKGKQKEHYENNKTKINEKKKEYYENKNTKINEKRRIKIECGCGNVYSYGDKARHFKTKKHNQFLENN